MGYVLVFLFYFSCFAIIIIAKLHAELYMAILVTLAIHTLDKSSISVFIWGWLLMTWWGLYSSMYYVDATGPAAVLIWLVFL